MKPYEYTEPDNGTKIEITRGSAGAFVEVNSFGDAHIADVPKSEVPAAALALYEAAGLPDPLILPGVEPGAMLVRGPHGEELADVSPSPAGSPSNAPGVMFSLHAGERRVSVRLIGDEPLRLASALANAMREAAAEPEPDDAEVNALALTIHKAKCGGGDGCQWAPTVDDRNAAVAVVRAGYAKREAGR